MKKIENEKEATNLKHFFEENTEEIIKYLVELYEFQESVKITYTIKNSEA